MNRQLLKKIKTYNPKWSQAIRDYLGEKVEYINQNVNENELDINVIDMCIVGEVYNFTSDYDRQVGNKPCDDCDNFGMQIWSNSTNSWDHKDDFERLLTQFYAHLDTEHKELVK